MDKIVRFSWVLLVMGIFALLVAAALFLAIPPQFVGQWDLGFGMGAAVLLGAYLFLDRDRVVAGASSRVFRYGFGSVVLVVLVGAIAVFGYAMARKHDHRWDMTGDKRFSLSEQTIKLARDLQQPVRVYAFFRSGSAEQHQFRDLAEGLELANPAIQVEFLDPLRHPSKAQEFEISSDYGTVVMVKGDQRQRLDSDFSEEALSAALIRLQSSVDHRICWSWGHGEGDPDDDYSGEGYGTLVVKMEGTNYTITKSSILTDGIEPGCEALVVARPLFDFAPVELESIAAYVAQGGRLLVMLEPGVSGEIARDLERYGALVGDDMVFDADMYSRPFAYQDDFTVMVFDRIGYGLHDITQALRGSTLLITSRTVEPAPAAPGLELTPLLSTSDTAWGEASFKQLAQVDPLDEETITRLMLPDPAVDRMGPISVALAVEVQDPSVLHVGEATEPAASPSPEELQEQGIEDLEGPEATVDAAPQPILPPGMGQIDLTDVSSAIPEGFAPEPGGRVVVFGDSEFATNRYILQGANRDLFLNAVAWLVEEEAQLAERPKDESGEIIELNLLEHALVWLVSLFIIPGLAVVVAIVILLRRRFL